MFRIAAATSAHGRRRADDGPLPGRVRLGDQPANVTSSTLVTAVLRARVRRGHVDRDAGRAAAPERPGRPGLAVAGVGLLVGFDTRHGQARPRGPACVRMLSALCFSLFQVCGRILASRYHPLQMLSAFLLVAVLALLPITSTSGLVTSLPTRGLGPVPLPRPGRVGPGLRVPGPGASHDAGHEGHHRLADRAADGREPRLASSSASAWGSRGSSARRCS